MGCIAYEFDGVSSVVNDLLLLLSRILSRICVVPVRFIVSIDSLNPHARHGAARFGYSLHGCGGRPCLISSDALQ